MLTTLQSVHFTNFLNTTTPTPAAYMCTLLLTVICAELFRLRRYLWCQNKSASLMKGQFSLYDALLSGLKRAVGTIPIPNWYLH